MRGDGRIFRRKGKDGKNLAIWHIAYWGPVDGKIVEIRESAGTSDERKARQFLKERLREVGNHRVGATKFQGPRQERVTVKDLLDALEQDYVQRGVKGLREAKNHMKPVHEFFDLRRALEVTPNLVREYIAERKKSVRLVGGKRIVGVANATINRETELLGRAFRFAAFEGTLTTAPAIPSLPENNARRGFFDRHEVESLIPHLRQPLADMAEFAYASGWRLGEIRRLRWEHVDRRAKEVRLPDSKNGEGRVLPLDENLVILIERCWTRREFKEPDRATTFISEFVFHFKGRPTPETTIRRWWVEALTKAGLPGRLFHDFRRSAVRDMIRAGVAQAVAMSISGHRTESMFRRYNISTTKDKLEALRLRRKYVDSQSTESNVAVFPAANTDTTRTPGGSA
jgi:integrase